MTDQLALDAAFLTGFIIGMYETNGAESPPAFMMPVIERVLKNGDAAIRKDADSCEKLPIASPPSFSENSLKPHKPLMDKPESVQPAKQTTPAAADSIISPADPFVGKAAALDTGKAIRKKYSKIPLDALPDIQKKRAEGIEGKLIAQEYEVSKATLYNFLKRHASVS